MLTRVEINALIALVMQAMIERYRYGFEHGDRLAGRVIPHDEVLKLCEQDTLLDGALAKLYAMRSVA